MSQPESESGARTSARLFARVGWLGGLRGAAGGGPRRPGLVAQAVLGLLLVVIGAGIWLTASENMNSLSAKTGYGFLFEPAPFQLGESLIPYTAGDSYLKAFTVGLLNTVKVALISILLSTLLGLMIALGQLSPSQVISRMCRAYIEVVRNVPLLLQLIFWYSFLTSSLPPVRQALSPVEGIYLTNRGLFLPALDLHQAGVPLGLSLLAGLLLAGLAVLLGRRAKQRNGRGLPGQPWIVLGALILPVLLAFLAVGGPVELTVPELKGFNFRGGITLTPEFTAMVMGLTLYTAAFNAEIIRAGILGVPKGQTEAALALGLKRPVVMRKIVLPQALRIIIPPMTNSYLNLTKESSLGVAIGYPELVRVANITLAETSQAFECITIIMLVYLTLSLTISAFLNWQNRRAKLVER